ncbi:MAG: nuclear transport factor 2 family protein [Thiohalomonadaceae bacterium]
MDIQEVSRTIHDGLEHSDVSKLMSLYDDDAELRLIDHNHPPSSPCILSGKQAISEYFNDVLSRPLKHRVEDEVMGDSHMAYTDSCEYPDGSKVFTSSMLTLKDGKIVKEVDVQAWDEVAPS